MSAPCGQTIGLWLQLPPGARLRGEGILQVLLPLLRRAHAPAGPRFLIACAAWTAPDLRRLLAEYDLDLPNIEILTGTPRPPRLLGLCGRQGPPTEPPSPGLIRRALLAPFRLVALLLAAVLRLVRIPLSWTRRLIRQLVLRSSFRPALAAWDALRRFRRFTSALRGRLRAALVRLARLPRACVNAAFRRPLLRRLCTSQFRALLRRANRRSDVSAWLVPNPAFHHAAALAAPRVVIVGDLVHRELPDLYPPGLFPDDEIQSLARSASAVISWSAHVRDRHAVGILGVPRDRTFLVPHAPLRVDRFLPDDPSACLRDYFRRSPFSPCWTPFLPDRYLNDFPFHQTPFLFYPSQIRPHKNHLALFHAFETLLRRRHRNLKLVITGRLHEGFPDLVDFLRAARLDLDVLSLPDLPPPVHACLYRLAALTVSPTLFEGDFPLLFTESLSVGTPILLSDIPAARISVSGPLADLMLFDPRDTAGLVARVEWALDHRDELLTAQRPLFEQLCQRTWDQAADEYLAVLARAAQSPRAQETNP